MIDGLRRRGSYDTLGGVTPSIKLDGRVVTARGAVVGSDESRESPNLHGAGRQA